MKVLGPLMIALLALGCSTPQDPAATPVSADTSAAAKPDNVQPRSLVGQAGGGAAVEALAGSYFVAAPNSDKNVTVKLQVAKDGTAELYLYWAETRKIEPIKGMATVKDGVLTIGNPKQSENFTVLENGGLKYAGTRADLEGVVLAKAQ